MALVKLTGNTSTIERIGDRVLKHITSFLDYGVFEREIHILKEFRGLWFVPTMIDFSIGHRVIEMEYVGEDLRTAKVPVNAGEQADSILAALECFRMHHNDIRPDNVTVKNGQLYLIDWQWAGRLTPPTDWPVNLGGKFRAGWPEWRFDDAVSLKKTLGLATMQS